MREVLLEEVDLSLKGFSRVGRGRSVRYLDPDGGAIEDEQTLERIRSLAIPPAWREVWISPLPHGHIQAVGVDAAGRRQYLYHEEWRRRRDEQKFARMESFAEALPPLRELILASLELPGLPPERVLACAVRLLDRGFFRVGGDEYAAEHHTFGLSTLERRHVRVSRGGTITFDYLAKGGKRRQLAIVDPPAAGVLASLVRRRSGTRLLAYRQGTAVGSSPGAAAGNGKPPARLRTGWAEVRATDINGFLKGQVGPDFTAKDFRTWHATTLAARAIAVLGANARTSSARTRAINLTCREVAHYLGNTPAVCRSSYIDPRVFERFQEGATIEQAAALSQSLQAEDPLSLHGDVEAAVLELLRG